MRKIRRAKFGAEELSVGGIVPLLMGTSISGGMEYVTERGGKAKKFLGTNETSLCKPMEGRGLKL